MRKTSVCVLMIAAALALSACAGQTEKRPDACQLLQEEYQSLSGSTMTARLRCEWKNETAEYTIGCQWNAEGASVVTVLEPESLSGITVQIDDEELTMRYDDMVLPARRVSDEAISPVQCLPMIMHAIRDGYLLECSGEKWGEEPCARLTFDTTGSSGEKIDYTIWFTGEHIPLHAEIAVGENVIFAVEFTHFSVQESSAENPTEEKKSS